MSLKGMLSMFSSVRPESENPGENKLPGTVYLRVASHGMPHLWIYGPDGSFETSLDGHEGENNGHACMRLAFQEIEKCCGERGYALKYGSPGE